ncbi:MAG: DUF4132 domain-containing protein [Polyangiaceae bacterium]
MSTKRKQQASADEGSTAAEAAASSAAKGLVSLEIRDFHEIPREQLEEHVKKAWLVPRSVEREFDQSRSVEFVHKALRNLKGRAAQQSHPLGHGWVDLPGALSKAEAYFMIEAINQTVQIDHDNTAAQRAALVKSLGALVVKADLTAEEAKKLFTQNYENVDNSWYYREQHIAMYLQAFRVFLGATETLKLWVESEGGPFPSEDAIHGIGPVADDEAGRKEQEELVAYLKDIIDKNYSSSDPTEYAEEVCATVARTYDDALILSTLDVLLSSDDARRWNHNSIADAAYSLSEDATYIESMKRLGGPTTLADVCRMMVRGGFETLDWSLPLLPKRDFSRGNAIDLLEKIHSVHMVPTMLAVSQQGASVGQREIAKRALDWLLREGANAVAGMLPVASKKNKAAERAASLLRTIHASGGEAIIEAQLASMPEKNAKALRSVLRIESSDASQPAASDWPEWALEVAPPSGEMFLTPASLPKLFTRQGSKLNDKQSASLLAVFSTRLGDDSGLAKARSLSDLLDPVSLGALIEHLFDGFFKKGTPVHLRWILDTVALNADIYALLSVDRFLGLLNPDSLELMEKYGLAAISRNPTPEIIWKLASLLKTEGAWGLSRRGELIGKALRAIAKTKSMSVDRMVELNLPTFGLSPQASIELDYGQRRIVLSLDSTGELKLQEKGGQVFKAIPPAKSTDDRAKVESAHATYRAVAAQIREYLRWRRAELEQAMLDTDSWAGPTWVEHWPTHPIDGYFARSLVWGEVDSKGTLLQTFRATDDGTLTSPADDQVKLSRGTRVRVVHPVELNESVLQSWRSQLSDYRIVQPFDQTTRRRYSLEEINAADYSMRLMPTKGTPIFYTKWVCTNASTEEGYFAWKQAKGLTIKASGSQGWDSDVGRYCQRVGKLQVVRGDEVLSSPESLTLKEKIGLSEALLALVQAYESPDQG